MADEVLKFKNLRKTKLAAFSRKHKSLKTLLESSPDATRLKEVLEEVKTVFKALEKAHEDYVSVIDEATLDTEGDYLDQPSNTLDTLETAIHQTIKRLESGDKFAKAKAKFRHGVENFGSPSKFITELTVAKEISFDDMHLELSKI